MTDHTYSHKCNENMTIVLDYQLCTCAECHSNLRIVFTNRQLYLYPHGGASPALRATITEYSDEYYSLFEKMVLSIKVRHGFTKVHKTVVGALLGEKDV